MLHYNVNNLHLKIRFYKSIMSSLINALKKKFTYNV